MRKIGLLYGMESTFPTAPVDRINSLKLADVRAENIPIGGSKLLAGHQLS
jgi:hypothetical protein